MKQTALVVHLRDEHGLDLSVGTRPPRWWLERVHEWAHEDRPAEHGHGQV